MELNELFDSKFQTVLALQRAFTEAKQADAELVVWKLGWFAVLFGCSVATEESLPALCDNQQYDTGLQARQKGGSFIPGGGWGACLGRQSKGGYEA